MDEYKVKKIVVRKNDAWIVVNSKGRIANNHKHNTEKAAKIHCQNLNAFCGR